MNRKTEKGQVLVIIALAMIAILGITALAIDGSLVYNSRRADQSTADSAVLAGAGAASQVLKAGNLSQFTCGSTLTSQAATAAVNAARLSAQDDGVDLLPFDLSTNNGVDVECGTEAGKTYLKIKAIVSTISEQRFGQVITNQPLRTTVEATSRVSLSGSTGGGMGIVSLSPNCGVQGGFDPASKPIDVIGGSVFSNSCLYGNGPVTVYGGGTISYIVTDYSSNSTPAPQRATQPVSINIPPPDCSGLLNRGSSTKGGTISPGNYTFIQAPGKTPLIFSPGLYCINSTSLNAFDANAGARVTAQGVTLYIKDGNFNVGSNVQLLMSAPNCSGGSTPTGVPPGVCGLLIYMDEPPSNPNQKSTQEMNLVGISGSTFSGTIYVPYGTIDVAGSGTTTTYETQLFGYRIITTGSGKVIFDVSGSNFYSQPGLSIDLMK